MESLPFRNARQPLSQSLRNRRLPGPFKTPQGLPGPFRTPQGLPAPSRGDVLVVVAGVTFVAINVALRLGP
ncbi:MAG: hypothetical protein ACKOYH_10000, partial [Cyanobium sp.]